MSGILEAHPDLQEGKGGGGGGRGGCGGDPDPEIRRGPGLKKKTFSGLWTSVWSKNRGRGERGVLHLDGLRRRLYEITFCESFV